MTRVVAFRSTTFVASHFWLAVGTAILLVLLASSESFHEFVLARFTRPKIFEVMGHVSVNGTPAKDIHVAFHPCNTDTYSSCPVGITDEHGVFQLHSGTATKGIPAGEYSVTFVWPSPTNLNDECDTSDGLAHDQLKGLYASTELGERVTVRHSGQEFRFGLYQPR